MVCKPHFDIGYTHRVNEIVEYYRTEMIDRALDNLDQSKDLPLDHPLVSLGVPGCWKFSFDYIPKNPVIYLNLYNNQWNNNFRYWYPGSWSSRVRIRTFEQDTDENNALIIPSMEARMPLLQKRPGTVLPRSLCSGQLYLNQLQKPLSELKKI